jgi:cytochrome c peroxidase
MKMRALVVPFVALPLVALACKEEPKSTSGPAASASATSSVSAAEVKLPPAPPIPATPVGLNELKAPEGNPMSAEKVWLGKQLFFDKRLSKDGTASCETCHLHEKGWTDGQQFSTKVGGGPNTRNTPSLYNVGYQTSWYWDGRAPSLEKQIDAAWKGQMGADPPSVAKTLAAIALYSAQFKKVFSADPSPDNIEQALGAYVRTLQSGNSPWDRYEKGDKTAASADAVAGQALFTGKAKCALCHAPPLYYDTLFHNVGIGMDKAQPDLGRGKISGDTKENGAFKTPGLRSVTKTGPYFHDGSEATLEGAVKLMVAGGKKNPNLDAKLTATKLTDKEVSQLIAFIQALDSAETLDRPALP